MDCAWLFVANGKKRDHQLFHRAQERGPTMRPSTFSSGPKEGSHNETHNETVNILIASLSEFSLLKQESHNETVNITSTRVPQWNGQHVYCFIIRVFIRLVLPHLPFQHQVFLYVHKSPTMKQLIYLCQEMSRDVKICQEMSRRYDKICQDMSRYVKICQDISRYDIS